MGETANNYKKEPKMSLITILATLAIIGLLLWILLQIPMPVQIKNVIIGVAILFIVLWLVKQFGFDVRI